MALILVGGLAKDIGKTTLICNIVSALPDLQWNAIKITSHEHEVRGCQLRVDGSSWSIFEQISAGTPSDTVRFFQAGAAKSFLIQVGNAALGEAFTALWKLVPRKANLIVESNRAAAILNPDLFLLIAAGAERGFKPSAEPQFGKVDAVLWTDPQGLGFQNVNPLLATKPTFQLLLDGLDPRLGSLIREIARHH
jgi:hypothetical protein